MQIGGGGEWQICAIVVVEASNKIDGVTTAAGAIVIISSGNNAAPVI